jgi:chromosome segregation ATPase
MTDRPAIIVTGDILNGLEFTGPFPDYDNAVEYTEDNGDITWIVADLKAPEGVKAPEPIAWVVDGPHERFAVRGKPNPAEGRTITPAYAAPQPSPEPGAIWIDERTYDALREQFDNLKEHYAKLSHRNDELDAARASLLRSEIKRWTEIQELRSEVEDQRAKYHALAMKSHKEWEELEALRASTIESDLTTEIEKLSAENRELSSIVTNQQRAMIDLHAEIEALKDERDGAVHTYTTVANERDTLEDECNDLAVERDELRAERVTLWNEREELKAKYEDLKARCTQPFFEGIVGERNELRRKYDALHAELEAQNDYVAWLQGRIKSMTTKRSDS